MEHTHEQNTTQSGLFSFDPIVVVMDVAKRWLVILLAALMVGVGTYVLTDMDYQPVYRTTTTFVVTNRGSSSTVYSNLSSTSALASVFSELLNSSLMEKTILQELGTGSFDGTISSGVISDTNLITVTVTASDPRTAYLVSRTIIEHHEDLTYQVIGGICLEVLQSPRVPTAPSNYNNATAEMKKMAVYAAIAATAVLVLVSWNRNTVRSGSEARQRLDCAYLGEISHERKSKTLRARLSRRKSSILVTAPGTSFRFVETFRKLRHRVEQQLHGRKVLMVTSLLENEGKSTVAVNLALSLAQKHKKVLLIDCDLRKPACHSILEQKTIPHSLGEVLTDRANLGEAIFREKKTGLYLLLESRSTHNSGDILGGQRMQQLIKWARREFDYVILDLPPMGQVSDGEKMAGLADASLLVVRQNTAPVGAINKAVAALEGSNARLLGCVLNNVYSTGLFSGQGYGYGYGHGYSKYGHYDRYGGYGTGKTR